VKNELKHINLLLSILLMWIGTSRVFAQQDPMYTQYMNNLQLVNPAYVGSADLLTVMAVSRNQWVSISGAPATQSVLAHSPIKTYNMGLGFSLLHDKVGVISQTGAYVDYSYFLDVTPTQRLALGLKGGVNFYDGGLTDLQTVDPDDPVFARDINRNFLPNFGIGALFYTDRYYVDCRSRS
jgi:type IX secretion system PorP/SprF family membrane protein